VERCSSPILVEDVRGQPDEVWDPEGGRAVASRRFPCALLPLRLGPGCDTLKTVQPVR